MPNLKKHILLCFTFVFIFIIFILIGAQSLNKNDFWSSGLEGITRGTLTFADINTDGYSDLILSGQNASIIIKVYLNNGTNLIENLTWQNNLTAFTRGSLALGDIDNDGDLDLALSGCTNDVDTSCSGTKLGKIYINNGTSFVESQQWEQNLTPVYWGSIIFGDINNDGKLDLVLTGNSDEGRISKIYLNNGTSFVENLQLENNLIGIDEGSIALGDIDNDGDLDLIHMGCCDHLYFYSNNGSSFVLNQTDVISGGDQLAGIYDGSLSLGDLDNDGDLDLATMGKEELRSGIYNWNETEFIKNDVLGADFRADNMQQGALTFVDLNNDTILDLICGGYSYERGSVTKVYINNETINNTLPSPPTTFDEDYDSDNGVLSLEWGNGSDNETPTLGLYYNLMIGNSTHNNTIVSGVYGGSSNPTAGYFGNMMQRKSIELNLNLSEGTYYWYVQTIDTSLSKSSWSSRQSFIVAITDIIAPIITSVTSSSITSSTATISWITNEFSNSTVNYGTTTSLGSETHSVSSVKSHSIGLSSLTASTLYYYKVSSCDSSGNCNTSSRYSFTTSDASTTNNNDDNPSGNSPNTNSTPEVMWTETYPVSEEEFTAGYNQELSVKNRLQINISNETHYVGVSELTNSTIIVNISSEPQIATLYIGDTRRFEVNEDNYYDINVTLNFINISSNKANITIILVHDEITNQTITEEQTKEENAQKEENMDNQKKLWYYLIVGFVIILIITVAIYLIKNIKKRKNGRS